MDIPNVFEITSFVASIASLALALVAMWTSKSAEKEVRTNFLKTQAVMQEYQERTKDVLAEIDKKSAVIERTVSDSQKQLLDTMTNIINQTVLPEKRDMGEELGLQFMQQLMSNPSQAGDIMQSLQPFIEMGLDKQKES